MRLTFTGRQTKLKFTPTQSST
eukprot:UN07459